MTTAFDAGAPADVTSLYEELGRFAVSKTAYLVGASEAEEIVQEAFLRLWQKRLRFESKKQAYQWIYTTCHNAAIDRLRRSRRRLQVGLDMVVEAKLEVPQSAAQRLANREILLAVLGRLSERDARIVAYRYVDGLQMQEIAAQMAVSEKTVQRALQGVGERVADLRRAFRE